jgi:hypothetical protein
MILNARNLNRAGLTVPTRTRLLGMQMSVDLFKAMGPSNLDSARKSRSAIHQLVVGASGTMKMALMRNSFSSKGL